VETSNIYRNVIKQQGISVHSLTTSINYSVLTMADRDSGLAPLLENQADQEMVGAPPPSGPPSGPGDTFAPISTRINPNNAAGYAPGAAVAASLLADQLALSALEAQIASQQVALSALQAQIVANQQNAAVISSRLMMTSSFTTNGMQHPSMFSSAVGNNLAGHELQSNETARTGQHQVLPQSLQQQQVRC